MLYSCLIKIDQEVFIMSKKQANIAATILEKVARNSVKMAADSRCMYVLHQPKQPAGMKEFRK